MNNIKNEIRNILVIIMCIALGYFGGQVEIYRGLHGSGVECTLSTALPPVTEDLR